MYESAVIRDMINSTSGLQFVVPIAKECVPNPINPITCS